MKFMLSLLALGYVALANSAPSLPVNPGGIGGLFKGPNSETIIKGPDGSVITSAAQGGAVQTNIDPVVVVEPVAVTPVVAAPAPVVETQQSSDLIGPSGRIATEGSQSVIAGPASTTVTGQAVVAETIVRGPPFVGTSVPVAVTAAPTVTLGSTLAPLSLTPVATLTADISPISLTASPTLVNVTPRVGPPSIATVTATPPIAIVTPSLQAVATASASPHSSIASVSSNQGATATASVSPNGASAVIETGAVTPSSTAVPTIGVQNLGIQGLIGINDRIDIPDQVATDNRQLNINPAAIPAINLIPPEIVVTPKTISGRLRPTPGTLLTTPGLGAVASSTNIQREEGDITLNVTPNTLQLQPQIGFTQQQLLALQNQQTLLNSQIQHAQQADTTGLVATNQRIIQADSRNRAANGGLINTNQQLIQTQSRNGAANGGLINTNQQLIQTQSGDGALLASTVQPGLINDGRIQTQYGDGALLASTVQPGLINDGRIQTQSGDGALLASTVQPGLINDGRNIPLGNIQQQQILNAQLARSGIDAAQLQLTNVPLSAVTTLGLENGANLKGGAINNGITTDAWGRYGRDAKDKKKVAEKKKRD